ncbi:MULTISPECIES: 16S rRNA (adenine(1518)-N(6)/adenine(1519)-N(6))-dimethyltransferase RsmA [Dictyoglomus]|jgi:16S rRNA (adenine1518-N6/adenine1519-N6)-dimethyltransferase|uniref:Ribosomal RNA small subunit methyltransferase A n=1 Tax=Dictyoglomus turgidum (strain DSM 6724 / Z-1310) TaxID=515635 RepID=B8E129_DICTD|nr:MULTISPECIES: 16S rRNA (adenine(1518)-N(6)/adenine(1519)-N(6))-dimethyltransferase RsmA [Dictyoglomus]ACK42766.1 dimethyladenosine transferase [Dictyoglomus turgidum DSM 6724]HBU30825.1 ribosomal RNA small subunit methyltransferase A [Dictyoglomus sp.]
MDLTSKSKLIEILRRNNIFLKKSLGQNFLIDKNILKKIIDALEISKEDNILEVGCGVGTLTLELAKKAKKVIGVEIDKRFKSILEELLKDYNNVEILFEDVLKLDLSRIINLPYKLVGNLPYYISGSFLGEYFQKGPYAHLMVIMLQKEMAERLTSSPGSKKYSPLSILLHITYSYEIISKVSPSCFFPAPEVESVVLKLKFNPKLDKIYNKEFFFKLIKESFNQRRKFLLNNLERAFPSIDWKYVFTELNIDGKIRAEELSPEGYITLSNKAFNLWKS